MSYATHSPSRRLYRWRWGTPIEGAVILGKVQPALAAMRAVATDADADDVTGRVLQPVCPVCLAQPPQCGVQGQRGDKGAVLQAAAIFERD